MEQTKIGTKTRLEVDPLAEIKSFTDQLKPGDQLELVLPPNQTSVAIMPIEMAKLRGLNQDGTLNDFFSVKMDTGSKLEVLGVTDEAIRVRISNKIAGEFSISRHASIWRHLKLQT